MSTPEKPKVVSEAVLLMDFVGSSVLTEKFGNQKAAEIKGDLDRIVRAAAAQLCGRFVKGTGDGYFITFPGELQATDCAIAILQALLPYNAESERPDFEIHLRVGIAFGEVVIDQYGDRQGNAANLSARFESMKPDTFSMDTVNGGMSADEFAKLTQDRILIDWRVEREIHASRSNLVRYVGLMKPKGLGTREEVYLVEWQRADPITIQYVMLDGDESAKRQKSVPTPQRALRSNEAPPSRFELRGMDWYDEADAA